MSLRMQLMQIIKVIMTYDYWICRPLLALNPCKVYQIMYAIVHSYSCKCMRNKYPICMKCPHTSHVEGDQFLNSQNAWACWDVVARAIIFDIPSLTVKCTLSLTKWMDNFSRLWLPNSHHSRPLRLFITWIYRKCKVLSCVKFTLANKKQAMYERSHVSVKVETRSTLHLISTLYILPPIRN